MTVQKGWPKREISVVAAYDGRCPECSEGIQEGDTIYKSPDDEWICEDCQEWYRR